MFECNNCGTYSHESIVIKKEGKKAVVEKYKVGDII